MKNGERLDREDVKFLAREGLLDLVVLE